MADIVVNIGPEDAARLLAKVKEQATELAALRLIVTEKFAGADMYVKPEDAADVARWAQHPEAVRELLKYMPLAEEFDDIVCAACSAVARMYTGDEPHTRGCTVAAAWRALGDPRGAADIERAWEEALRQNVRLFPQFVSNGEPNDAPLARLATALWRTTEATLGPIGGLSAHEQRALYGRHMYAPDETATPPDPDEAEQRWAIVNWGAAAGALVAQRQRSDARGMEAVEEEARDATRWRMRRR